ncbi:MAG: putative homoserine kinase [Clostridia bacterium]|jgi:2,3-bisphosphoglycerate-independent phosphoglycerate mutase|uniref:cofactor-independent phosphoglycerate mutase n=1 Tax=Petroclostridium xylanilyticum TaxID=1792311 RepID=UPI000B98D3EB|nr:cofactor-independent phosphoglycerate mutase [Petroclostridium xylanilyticum]MBZ4646919.1 putative homoserine kinase [Clostridia bacterium]
MKYVVILGDGMADNPVVQLGDKTPLQFANIPTIDYLTRHGEIGLVKTVPDGIPPGSDAANLSVMGYNPYEYYTGRSPLEAASMGIELTNSDITFRCNLVTLSNDEPYSEKTMIDYSADEISTAEAREIILEVNRHLRTDNIEFYPGVSYRHLMVWHNGPYEFDFTPPHDILEKKIADYLPKGPNKNIILRMMEASSEFLKNHPVNLRRIEKGLRPANSIWIWGEGKKPALTSFYEKYGLKGSVISAVDLIKGIGICAGLRSVEVEGATGNIHTNFIGKAQAAVEELKKGQDFVYVHIEAPDECGHRYEIDNKVRSIEIIDQQVVRFIKEELDRMGEDYKIMVLPDHPTPLNLRTHTSEPVPFVIYQNNGKEENPLLSYDELTAQKTGVYFAEGYKLMDYFLNGEK